MVTASTDILGFALFLGLASYFVVWHVWSCVCPAPLPWLAYCKDLGGTLFEVAKAGHLHSRSAARTLTAERGRNMNATLPKAFLAGQIP